MRYLLPLILLAVLISCKPEHSASGQEAPKPDTLIPRDTMILILADVHLTEAAVSFLKSRGDKEKGLTERYYEVLFSKYRISRNTFESNFTYYKSDQEDFISMYEEVVKNLEKMQKKGQSSEE